MSSVPSRGYIAGKPVSRWEAADSDNIDIEYKNLDQPTRQTWHGEFFAGPKGILLKILFLIVIFCFGLVFGYLIRKDACKVGAEGEWPDANDIKFVPIQQDYDEKVRHELQERISHPLNFEDSIRMVASHLPLSGVGRTVQLLYYTRNIWSLFHLDIAAIRNYTVLLMYPNYTMEDANKVTIISENETYFQTYTNGTSVHPNYLPFVAFSQSGHVKGPLVYGHYGRKEDFEMLKKLEVDLNKTIILLRYGKTHPSNKIHLAEKVGALGVILYPDPQDYTDKGINQTENVNLSNTWWLPGDAVVRSSVRYWHTGDPLTPDYPAIDEIPRLSNDLDGSSKIPVFPVSFNDARQLMKDLSGVDVPREWTGGLGISYKTGPGYSGQLQNYEVDLNVKNEFLFREIHNIIATIHGQFEKDHYIIIGAHIDSWSVGAIDAGTGYAVLMDLIRTFSEQRRKGWRPRRTIIFAGWDASKYGHVGAYEWMQEYEEQLSSGAVAYINLDAAVRGNYTFFAEASPLLHDVIYTATKTVASPNDFNSTVYDDWQNRLKDATSLENRPWIADLPGDSDHSPFLYRLGISSMSAAFTYNIQEYPFLPTYPVYATLSDTENYLLKYIDPNFNVTTALVQVLCDIVLQLSDKAILPFSVIGYNKMLDRGIRGLEPYREKLIQAELKMDLLLSAVESFKMATSIFQKNYASIDKKNISEFEVQFLNNKLIRLSRAFVHTGGVMAQPQYRNILIAPHPENLNQEIIFPGIITAALKVDEISFTEWKSQIRKQFAIVVVCVQRARNILLESYPNESL